MRLNVGIRTFVSASVAFSATAHATTGMPELLPERQDLLIQILRDNDCRVREFSHDPKVVEALEKHEMDHRELRAVSEDLVKDGVIKRWGDVLILRDGSCS